MIAGTLRVTDPNWAGHALWAAACADAENPAPPPKECEILDLSGMPGSTLIPVGEYQETIYRPDCDYIDGEVLERNVLGREHSAMQPIPVGIVHANRWPWGVFGMPEIRTQVAQFNYRVADVCIVRASDPRDRIVRTAPLICIEILSNGDKFTELKKKVDDYVAMGVENIWTLDPWNQQ